MVIPVCRPVSSFVPVSCVSRSNPARHCISHFLSLWHPLLLFILTFSSSRVSFWALLMILREGKATEDVIVPCLHKLSWN